MGREEEKTRERREGGGVLKAVKFEWRGRAGGRRTTTLTNKKRREIRRGYTTKSSYGEKGEGPEGKEEEEVLM